jgi:predicted RNase H-like HicB family nuclease
MQTGNSDIIVEHDEIYGYYYTVWQPLPVIGVGPTPGEALEDIRAAAHLGIDTLINLKLNEPV